MYVLNLKRYSNPKLLEHLASHYVLGNLTTLVRNRVERLAKELPELREQITMWQIRFESMHQAPSKQPPKIVWQNLQKQLNSPKVESKSTISEIINQYLWKCTSAIMAFALVVFISMPAVEHQNPILGYTASMNNENKDTQFVINIYKDTQASNTFIKFLMNQRLEDENLEGTLWAKGFDNDELVEIGNINTLMNHQVLTKAQWGLIKSSKELVVTKTIDPASDRIFEGICVQLGDWS